MAMTLKGITSRLSKQLMPFLGELGYVEKPAKRFTKEPFSSYVSFNILPEMNRFGILASAGRSYRTIEDYWEPYQHMLQGMQQPYPLTVGFFKSTIDYDFTGVYPPRYTPERYVIKEEMEISLYVESFKKDFEELFIPYLKQTEDIRWLDKGLNTNPLEFKNLPKVFPTIGNMFRKIIVARLAGNPSYEEICTLIRGFILQYDDDYMKNSLNVFDKVYEHLKPVEALTSPFLDR
jgi:hypothetical protein